MLFPPMMRAVRSANASHTRIAQASRFTSTKPGMSPDTGGGGESESRIPTTSAWGTTIQMGEPASHQEVRV